MKLIIDLEDGLPPTTIEKTVAPRPGARITDSTPIVPVTRIPVALTISYAPIHCLGCGGEHKDHRGIFIEYSVGNKARVLTRVSMREAGTFRKLPRRVDIAPAETVPVCSDCFMLERIFTQAVAEAQAQAELPFEAPPLEAHHGASQEYQTAVQDLAKLLHELREDGAI